MNKSEVKDSDQHGDEPGSGPNLKLMYGLILFAMLAAIAAAALIVLPFYHHH
jgi:hypothetical protein